MGDHPSRRAPEAESRPPEVLRTPLAARSPGRALPTLAGLTAVYFVAGKLGLKLALVHASASAVRPATGIALAAFMLLGPRAWPAILAGAWLVNVTTAGSALTSLGIAVGNTLEGLLGSWLVLRFAGGPRAFERARNVFKFAALAGLASPAVSATCGVTSLWLGGYASQAAYPSIWLTWWLGDVGGSLVVAPLLVLWATRPRPRWNGVRALEGALLLALLLAVGLAVFGGLLPWARSLSFLSLPLLLWAALRFDQRDAATAGALLSGLAVWGALRGVGSFGNATPNTSLVLVQAFMGVSAVTTLAVAATVLQRRRAEEALSRTAAIVDFSEDAIIGKSMDGTIVSWNPGAERLYGYSAAEVLGRNISILEPADRSGEMRQNLECVERGERVEPYETVRVRRDGRSVAVSLTVSPIRDAAGRVVGASAIARDITHRKRAEERLEGQFAVTRVLAESASLREAAPRLLRAIGEGFGWEAGELWRVADAGGPLRLEATWSEPDVAGPARPGDPDGLAPALVARAGESGGHVWVDDLTVDEALAQSRAAAAGLRGALAWPVVLGSEVVALLAFFSRQRRAPRQELLDQMGDVGARIAQFREREQALEGMRRLQKAVETIELGVTITDVNGRILYTNPAEAAMHGHRPEELLGKHVSTFMPEGWMPARGRPSEIRSWKRETINVRRDGTVFPVQLLSDLVRDADGTPLAVVTCSEEITERKRAEEALRSSEERYRLLFERNLAGVYRATLDGRILECNDAVAQILGYASREEVLAKSVWDLSHSRQKRTAALSQLRERGTLTNVELRLRRKDGGSAWVLENQTLLIGDDGEELVEATLIDITDRKEFEQRIEFQAFHDPLTGLPNRTFLRQRLELLLSEVQWSDRGLALMFVDLDQFKAVNDTLGHSVGDRLLQQAAARLRECVREDDSVARVGGDEFVLLLPHVRQPGAARVARQVLARMQEPFRIDDHELYATASVGIALFPHGGRDAEALLKHADSAMYRAKESGRNTFQFWDADAKPAGGARLETNAQLHHALERGEMAVFYQPQVELATGKTIGAEALLRWHHPERGVVLPGEFVPMAEEIGLIVPLGKWVLRTACATARSWQDAGLPPLRLSVNLSIRQLQQPRLRSLVEAVLQETGFPPRCLELEITETVAMQNVDLTAPVLRHFVGMGIGISIDDFGIGYSSLSHLRLLPIHRLKIDRSFIAGIGHVPRDTAIVGAIVQMAHTLGIAVLAEGVESQEQIEILRGLHCDEGQGRAFGGAVPAEEFEKQLSLARR